MRATIALFFLMTGLMLATPKDPAEKHVVLPNPELIRHCSSASSQFWDGKSSADDIYPSQLIIDIAGPKCPKGVVALYDASVSLADVKSALDQRYGNWANANNSKLQVKIWRVESENLAIQLAEVDSHAEVPTSSSTTPGGIKSLKNSLQVIYLPLSGSACDCGSGSATKP